MGQAMPRSQAPGPPELHVIVCVAFRKGACPGKIAELKKTVVACPSVVHSVEVTGTFDFMAELAVPDIATFNQRLSAVATAVSDLVERYEVNFVGRRFIRRHDDARALWVHSEEGLRRVEPSLITKVTAEGDYMRIHANGSSWMLHATMRSVVERLGTRDFLQLHRSSLVRVDQIDALAHESGHWVAKLRDGTSERVARSHVAETLRRLRIG